MSQAGSIANTPPRKPFDSTPPRQSPAAPNIIQDAVSLPLRAWAQVLRATGDALGLEPEGNLMYAPGKGRVPLYLAMTGVAVLGAVGGAVTLAKMAAR